MSTRSLTIVTKSDGGEEIMVMYRHSDGYPDGHGKELFDAFGTVKICNGISFNKTTGHYANGMECLAAQIVSHFKDGIGGIYLYPSGTRDTWEDYIYYLYRNSNGDVCLRLSVPDNIIFDDVFVKFGTWLDQRKQR